MMTTHIRCDYLEACADLANWNSTFYERNLLPELAFTLGKVPLDVQEHYNEQCLPTNEYILSKITSSKAA